MLVVRNKAQKIFLITAGVFLAFLLLVALIRSFTRSSIISLASSGLEYAGEALPEQLHLQDFHRVQVKDGETVWEITAKDAKFFTEEDLTHVNDASVVIHRPNKPSVKITSKAARLYLDGSVLKKAEMEGDIVVVMDDSVTATTDIATYDDSLRKVTTASEVEILGPGMNIKGVGLELDVDTETVKLLKDVRSVFENEKPQKS